MHANFRAESQNSGRNDERTLSAALNESKLKENLSTSITIWLSLNELIGGTFLQSVLLIKVSPPTKKKTQICALVLGEKICTCNQISVGYVLLFATLMDQTGKFENIEDFC